MPSKQSDSDVSILKRLVGTYVLKYKRALGIALGGMLTVAAMTALTAWMLDPIIRGLQNRDYYTELFGTENWFIWLALIVIVIQFAKAGGMYI